MVNTGNEGSDLIVAIGDGVAVLTLNRPERLNALSRPMIDCASPRSSAAPTIRRSAASSSRAPGVAFARAAT